jgi:hypothetical protein
MSTASAASVGPGECPDRVAIETPRGNVRVGPVVECDMRIDDCRPIPTVRVRIEGHTLEVPAREALPP